MNIISLHMCYLLLVLEIVHIRMGRIQNVNNLFSVSGLDDAVKVHTEEAFYHFGSYDDACS